MLFVLAVVGNIWRNWAFGLDEVVGKVGGRSKGFVGLCILIRQ